MKNKWSYIAVEYETLALFERAANTYGEQGWELVGFQHVGQMLVVRAVFKRMVKS